MFYRTSSCFRFECVHSLIRWYLYNKINKPPPPKTKPIDCAKYIYGNIRNLFRSRLYLLHIVLAAPKKDSSAGAKLLTAQSKLIVTWQPHRRRRQVWKWNWICNVVISVLCLFPFLILFFVTFLPSFPESCHLIYGIYMFCIRVVPAVDDWTTWRNDDFGASCWIIYIYMCVYEGAEEEGEETFFGWRTNILLCFRFSEETEWKKQVSTSLFVCRRPCLYNLVVAGVVYL